MGSNQSDTETASTGDTYPNADARPHTGDRVAVDSSQTPRLQDDVAGRVTGSHTSSVTGEKMVEVRHGSKAGSYPYKLTALTLLEATENRFDGFEPGHVESWEKPAIQYGTYVPNRTKGALVAKKSDSKIKLERTPRTSDDRVVRFMEKHGWSHDFTRDEAGAHGIMHFSPR